MLVNFQYTLKSCGLIALKANYIKPYDLTVYLYEKKGCLPIASYHLSIAYKLQPTHDPKLCSKSY